ncbi:hypothetical protein ACHAXT_009889 [Thalassiosira profunda]
MAARRATLVFLLAAAARTATSSTAVPGADYIGEGTPLPGTLTTTDPAQQTGGANAATPDACYTYCGGAAGTLRGFVWYDGDADPGEPATDGSANACTCYTSATEELYGFAAAAGTFDYVYTIGGREPSSQPSNAPSAQPSVAPSEAPSSQPSPQPSADPSAQPSSIPSEVPSTSAAPSLQPSESPSRSSEPSTSAAPSLQPSDRPSTSTEPSEAPSSLPSEAPSSQPSSRPTGTPSAVRGAIHFVGAKHVHGTVKAALDVAVRIDLANLSAVGTTFIHAERNAVDEHRAKRSTDVPAVIISQRDAFYLRGTFLSALESSKRVAIKRAVFSTLAGPQFSAFASTVGSTEFAAIRGPQLSAFAGTVGPTQLNSIGEPQFSAIRSTLPEAVDPALNEPICLAMANVFAF